MARPIKSRSLSTAGLEFNRLTTKGNQDLGFWFEFPKGIAPGERGGFSPVHGHNLADIAGNRVYVLNQFGFPRVTREGVDSSHLRLDFVGFSENIDDLCAGKNVGTQGVFSAKADKKNQVFWAFSVIDEVVSDAAGLSHPRRTDDDAGIFEFVELLRVRDIPDVREILHPEWVPLIVEILVGLLVKAFRVKTEYFRGIHGEGAVDKDRHAVQFAFIGELVELVNELLSPSDGESGNDDLSAPLERLGNQAAEVASGVNRVMMLSIAVSAFDLEEIDVFDGHGIPENILVRAANITAEEVAKFAAFFLDIEDHLGGAQDMAGIDEGDRHTRGDQHGAVVADRDKELRNLMSIMGIIERFNGWEPLLGSLFGDILAIRPLDLCGIGEHQGGEIASCKGAENVGPEALFIEVRKIPHMIDVGMADDRHIDRDWIKCKCPVPLEGFFTPALKQSALHQNALPVYLN